MKKQLTTGWLIEHGLISSSLLLSLFLPIPAVAQPVADPQDQAARMFMTAMFDKDNNQVWKLMDPEAQKNTTLENLAQVAKATDTLAKVYGRELLEFLRGFRTFHTGQTIWGIHV